MKSLRHTVRTFALPFAIVGVTLPYLSALAQNHVVAPRVTQRVDGSKRVMLSGHVRPFLRLATDQGEVAGGTATGAIMMMFSRTAQQQADLDSLADTLHNRNSPQFHQWLTPEQFGKQFSPADSDIAQVRSWLEGQGFHVLDVPPSKTFISFSGNVGQLKSAFGVSIHKLTINGEKHAATVNEPQIPAALAAVVGDIRGLDNFSPKPLIRRAGAFKKDLATGKVTKVADADGTPVPEFTTTGGYFEVGPQDFYAIYGENSLLSQGITGAGKTIAVLEETQVNSADVTSFRSMFGLPAYPSTATSADGGVNYLYGSATGLNGYASCFAPETTAQNSTYGEEGEADLDLQWAGAVAPKATIDFVACGGTVSNPQGTGVGSYGTDQASQYVVNYLQSSVVAASLSYGECEANMSAGAIGYYNKLWQQYAVEGITAIVSSGDGGAEGCYQNGSAANGGLPTSLPSSTNGLGSSAWNVSAGGTDFADAYETNNYSTLPATTWWNSTNGTGYGSATGYIPETTWGGYCSNSLFVSLLQKRGSTTFGSTYTPQAICSSAAASTSYKDYAAVAGGSGGISTVTTIPSWQSVYGVGANGTSSTYRNSPDVSLFAASGFWGHNLPYCESDDTACTLTNYNAGYLAAGGTSFVAPQLAGFMALVAQKTGMSQGQANYTLYNLAAQQYGTTGTPSANISNCSGSALVGGAQPASNCIFHDVSSDTPSLQGGTITGTIAQPCNASYSNCFGNGSTYGISTIPGQTPSNSTVAYPVGPGYDDATGLGSFNIANLVNGWNNTSPALPSTTVLNSSATTAASTDTVIFTANVTATGRGGNVSPAGMVTFYLNGSTTLGTGTISPACTGSGTTLSCAGIATLSVSGAALPSGSNSYTAYFAGDAANDAASTSAAIAVTGPVTTPGIRVISPTIMTGATGYITAYISFAGAVAPTGTVSMLVNGSSANISNMTCRAKAQHTNCTATYSAVGVTPGNFNLIVSQTADANYSASSGSGFVTVYPSTAPHVAPVSPVTGSSSDPKAMPVAKTLSAINPVTVASPAVHMAPSLAMNLNGDADASSTDDYTQEKAKAKKVSSQR